MLMEELETLIEITLGTTDYLKYVRALFFFSKKLTPETFERLPEEKYKSLKMPSWLSLDRAV